MRRRALLCLAVPGGMAFGRAALAWQERPAADDVARAWLARCAAMPSVSGAPLAICPFCGCPAYGAPDHGEAKPPR